MTVEENKVVGISYTLWDGEGEELESRGEDEPFHYLHGHSNIVPGLEAELSGLEEGDEFEVELAPEDAYGEYDESFIYRINRDDIPAEMDLKPGMPLELAPEGQDDMRMLVYVKEVAGDEVILDGNQPLAGKDLRFKGKVVETRDATEEEVAHGHAHTGHHHH